MKRPSPSARTASFRSGLRRSPSARRAESCILTAPPRCSTSFDLPKTAATTGASCKASNEFLPRPSSSELTIARSHQPIFDWARFHFFDQIRLWFNHPHLSYGNSSEAYQNTITLSEAFYDEIDQHRIPVEREVVAALANAPGLLDFYVWLVWKSWTVHGQPAHVPLFGPNGLCEQLGTEEYSEPRFFRRKIHFWLRHVSVLWPHCPARISQDGMSLTIHSSRHAPAIRGVEKPANSR